MTSRRATRILRTLLWVLGTVFVLALAATAYLYRLSLSLPDLEVGPAATAAERTSVVYAADGSVLAEWHGEVDRTMIAYEDMSGDVRDAVVAVEDQRFYSHNGVDWEAIARAFTANTKSGAVSQGGSTITQQLVKLLFTDGKRTLGRKAREALLAFELESKADKRKVLETYLNIVYFGRGAYGIEAASRTYFGKSAADLTLAESALLAGVIRSPGRYSPTEDPEAAVERRNVVLSKMREQGFITSDQELAAKREPLKLVARRPEAVRAPYFVEYVKTQLIDRLGAEAVYTGGLRVYTTLDPRLQAEAEAAAGRALPSASDPEVALVSIRHKTGDIVAMVGGRDFARDKFNLASQGRRQPGSAFKPFVLVAALEKGISPDSKWSGAPYSVPVTDGVWKVENYEGGFSSGMLSLRDATAFSVNGVYARLIMAVGTERVIEVAHRMGIVSTLDPNPAIALGGLSQGVTPLEMASAYGTIASGGTHAEPGGIVKVTDDAGAVVYQPSRPATRVVDERVAVTASTVLHDVVERGTGTAAKMAAWAAGKTGTTQSYRDAWFVGYTGDLVTAVWVGHRAAQVDMTNVHGTKVTGGSYPARIWSDFMYRVRSPEGAAPAGAAGDAAVKRVRICLDTMLLANQRCPNWADMDLPADTAPLGVCTEH
ncbi:MAG: PBP1A family penicillin-binding protein [Actinobacteria bacterium]|nr:MAG: PBP1A family penicillin-binding protein [Actinomycetota bacterium]